VRYHERLLIDLPPNFEVLQGDALDVIERVAVSAFSAPSVVSSLALPEKRCDPDGFVFRDRRGDRFDSKLD
jgi:hypothetical protein